MAELPMLHWTCHVDERFARYPLSRIAMGVVTRGDRMLYKAAYPHQKSLDAKIAEDPKKIARIQAIIGKIADTGVRLVQIGAHDGQFDDPLSYHIQQNHWRALLVEPQIEAFQHLEQRYSGIDNVQPVNIAVAEQAGVLTLYKALLQGDLASQGTAIASTNKQQVRREAMRNAGLVRGGLAKIVTEQVPTLTLPQVLDTYNFDPKSIDFFACDTEGYDATIMNQLFRDTDAKPALVQWEHLHLDADTADTIARVARVDRGYELITTHKDTFGYLPKAL